MRRRGAFRHGLPYGWWKSFAFQTFLIYSLTVAMFAVMGLTIVYLGATR